MGACAVAGGENGEADGHVKDDERDEERGGNAGECGEVSFDPEAGHQDEKDKQRQGGEGGGEKPGACRVVALRPVAGESWGLPEDEGHDGEQAEPDEDGEQAVS